MPFINDFIKFKSGNSFNYKNEESELGKTREILPEQAGEAGEREISSDLRGAANSSFQEQEFDPDTLTPRGEELREAATKANSGQMRSNSGGTRAEEFKKYGAFQILAEDIGAQLHADPKKIEPVLDKILKGSGDIGKTLGNMFVEKGPTFAPDPSYPVRAVKGAWNEFASKLGIAPKNIDAVTKFNAEIAQMKVRSGQEVPNRHDLSSKNSDLVKNVAKSLLGQTMPKDLTPEDRALVDALKANLLLSNFAWHTTNWALAARDGKLAEPLSGRREFNTLSDAVKYANARGGRKAVEEMILRTAYSNGQADTGAADFANLREDPGDIRNTPWTDKDGNSLQGNGPAIAEAAIDANVDGSSFVVNLGRSGLELWYEWKKRHEGEPG